MPRLFVIPARDVPVAVILRRGPSRWYHVIEWNTATDTFNHGAWIQGRIYEEKCDVSPDGQLLVSFVFQGSRSGTRFTDSWTAVSRVPWLHALTLWPQGTTYDGGGRFLESRKLVLRPLRYDPKPMTHPDFPVRGIEVVYGRSPELHRSANEVADADWSGGDHQGHIIYSRAGRLFRRIDGDEQLVADFTNLTPDPKPAPDWATQPL